MCDELSAAPGDAVTVVVAAAEVVLALLLGVELSVQQQDRDESCCADGEVVERSEGEPFFDGHRVFLLSSTSLLLSEDVHTE